MLLASAVLAALVAAVFIGMLLAISTLRDATEREARAKDTVTAAVTLEKLVLDIESGLRGLVLSGNERFLDPYTRARAQLPQRLQTFEALAADDPDQRDRARRLARNIRNYRDDYAALIVPIAREDPEVARSSSFLTAEGNRRIVEIRQQFQTFVAAEDTRAAQQADTASERADLAIALGVLGVLVSALFTVLFGTYLARSIARPVRGVAQGASRLAAGELSLRLGEGGPGEVGELTRSFNAMAATIERSRRSLEEQNELLRESERAQSELVGIVSHEVRTPLASVLGFTSLLLTRETDDATRRRYLEIIDAQGRRLNALLDDFLDVQRLEEGRLELVSELVDMSSLLREQVALFEAQSQLHRLELSVPTRPLAVHGDPNRLAQVVGNLLSNAIKYSPEGGVVEVVGEGRNGGVRVTVRDNGVGIPDEQHDRIFTKFFRGDAATSGIAGSGLGLAFARAVVEAHGGSIGFSSTEGRGSTFYLELPTAAAA
jgi:signal transduction histidine kinase